MLEPWLILNRAHHLTQKTLNNLLLKLGSAEAIVNAKEQELVAAGMPSGAVRQIKNIKYSEIEEELAWAEKPDQFIINQKDPRYPKLLKQIPDPPFVLYISGDINLLKSQQIAVVGSRNPSPVGIENANQFAVALCELGFTITSGLALGIDAVSHQSTLNVKGKTLAVLGNGLNHTYPKKNRTLYQQIAQYGTLVTELPLNTPPVSLNFPKRNRIISGLSLGTLVIEASLKSGSLITARLATEQGREVFAIPGSIHNPLARGTHALIKNGAKLIENIQDITDELTHLAHFNSLKKNASKITKKDNILSKCKIGKLDKQQRKLLEYVDFEVTNIEQIITRSGFSAQTVASVLLILELNGYIKSSAAGYSRVKI